MLRAVPDALQVRQHYEDHPEEYVPDVRKDVVEVRDVDDEFVRQGAEEVVVAQVVVSGVVDDLQWRW